MGNNHSMGDIFMLSASTADPRVDRIDGGREMALLLKLLLRRKSTQPNASLQRILHEEALRSLITLI
jgi:hypothetical protein